MTNLIHELNGCLGSVDRNFGDHPCDHRRALQLKRKIDQGRYPFAMVRQTLIEILTKEGVSPSHLQAQLKQFDLIVSH